MEQTAGSVNVVINLGMEGMVDRPYVITQINLGAWNVSGLAREVLSRDVWLVCAHAEQ